MCWCRSVNRPDPSEGSGCALKSASGPVGRGTRIRPPPNTRRRLQEKEAVIRLHLLGSGSEWSCDLQAGCCRPRAEWTAAPRVPHRDASSFTGDKKRIVRSQIMTGDQRDQSASACVSNPGSDRVVRTEETAAVPALKLCSGGCWVILSFTHEPVRVSKSGGTVSVSERGGGVREQQRSHKGSFSQ